MGDPEIHNDEKVLLRTPGVYVKSIPFEGILTNKRVILVDRAKNLLPPKEIPFATIKNVESGENAIRDQILTLSVMAKTGGTRQMILTFSRQEGGKRIKERDEWARIIRENIGSSFDNVIRRVIPGNEPQAPAAPPAPSRIRVITPIQPAAEPVPSAPVRSEPATVHPLRKIIEAGTIASSPASPAPTRSEAPAPAQYVFCTRCGNKVPHDSAFCNRCGSAIVAPSAPGSPPPQPAAASAPQSQRPIDQDITTIEPLIERSTVRIPADPLRKPIPDVSVNESLAWDDDESSSPAPEPVAAPARIPAERDTTPAPAAPGPAAAPPVPKKPKRSFGFTPSRNMLLGVGAVVLLLVIVAVGALVVLPMLSSGGLSLPSVPGDAGPTPTSSSSTTLTMGTIQIRETPAPVIPVTGVQVHVQYLGGFKGSYGMPDALTTVPGNSGDRVWEVENANGTVIAEFEKLDGSNHELLVEIFKDGSVLTRDTTTIGHGSVKLSADVSSGVAATPVSSNGAATEATTVPLPTTA
ncbi:MAG: hypothetical protein CVV32_12350 [Methanomicrobiales archaeon HGW-Methanomicrobiales-3]|nr:MAG: hypothetical protein CVV32_12350 [Methanomicrobiales archaeon HGW-Methanomicrobiales-3]